MLIILFHIYRLSPVGFGFLMKFFPSIALYINREIVFLLGKKNLSEIYKIWDLGFLKVADINLNALSILTIETFIDENKSINKILVKLCSYLINYSNDTPGVKTKTEKRDYWLSEDNNWVYTLIDLSVSNGNISIYALELLESELNSDDFFLSNEDVLILQFLMLSERVKNRISFEVMLTCFKSHLISLEY